MGGLRDRVNHIVYIQNKCVIDVTSLETGPRPEASVKRKPINAYQIKSNQVGACGFECG